MVENEEFFEILLCHIVASRKGQNIRWQLSLLSIGGLIDTLGPLLRALASLLGRGGLLNRDRL